MSDLELELARRLAELRDGFDSSFAQPPPVDATARIGLLAVTVAGDGYVIRLDELADIHPVCRTVALPGARRGLLGIAGIRGRLVPVYGLATLLRGSEAGPWRWLALCAQSQPLGLAFERLDGYLEASPEQFVPAAETDHSPGHVRQILRQSQATRMVLSTRSILEALNDGRRPSGAE